MEHILFHVVLGKLSDMVYERGDQGKCYGGRNIASIYGIKHLQENIHKQQIKFPRSGAKVNDVGRRIHVYMFSYS